MERRKSHFATSFLSGMNRGDWNLQEHHRPRALYTWKSFVSVRLCSGSSRSRFTMQIKFGGSWHQHAICWIAESFALHYTLMCVIVKVITKRWQKMAAIVDVKSPFLSAFGVCAVKTSHLNVCCDGFQHFITKCWVVGCFLSHLSITIHDVLLRGGNTTFKTENHEISRIIRM